MKTITAVELKKQLDTLPENEQPILLDVREPQEHDICKIENSVLIPMGEIPNRLNELNPDKTVITICHHGMRSMQVALFLENSGFPNVINLTGGIQAWSQNVDPKMPCY